jgi:hypothetical protein
MQSESECYRNARACPHVSARLSENDELKATNPKRQTQRQSAAFTLANAAEN